MFKTTRHNRYMSLEQYLATVTTLRQHALWALIGMRCFVQSLKNIGPDEEVRDMTRADITSAIAHADCLLGSPMTGLIVGLVAAAFDYLKGVTVASMTRVAPPADDSWWDLQAFEMATGVRLEMLATWSKVKPLFDAQEALVKGGVELDANAGMLMDAAMLMGAFGEEVAVAIEDMKQ
jgi:hypothetical protein